MKHTFLRFVNVHILRLEAIINLVFGGIAPMHAPIPLKITDYYPGVIEQWINSNKSVSGIYQY